MSRGTPGRRRAVVRALATVAWLGGLAAAAPWARHRPAVVVGLGLATLVAWVLVFQGPAPRRGPRLRPSHETPWGRFVSSPSRVLVAAFLLLAVVGTAALALPPAATAGRLRLVDAAFTAVSATCVTGLVVFDPAAALTPFGEASLLVVIQLGGLGIMGFYALAFALVGRRLSLREERALTHVLQVRERARLWQFIRDILAVTLVAEIAGAVVLCLAFRGHGDDWPMAAWRGAFTAVSAFCNAGFALQPDSLAPYARDPVVLHTVAALIVVGGLSPGVVLALPGALRDRRIETHARLVLVTSGVLLLGSFLAFAAFEWRASLGGLSVPDRLHAAWLHAATLRTAGFASVDLGETRSATRALMVAMMFIGGSPGGTAGGVKTTTVAVLALTVIATLQREPSVVAFRRRLPQRKVYEAASVVSVGLVVGLVAFLALALTQAIDAEVLFFEVVSALGTVGLSLGATSQVDDVGKWILMVCMLAGRVGPLALVLSLAGTRRRRIVSHPEAEVEIG